MSSGWCSVRSGLEAGRVFMALGAIAIFSGGCSGGGGTSTAGSKEAAAATATAETNAACIAVAPFYWEIGDAGGTLVSGSVGSAAPVASTVMSIASSSKWLFGAYAVQKMGGTPAATYIPFFNMTSGYAGATSNSCPPSGTVDDCLADPAGAPVDAEVGKFNYNDG